MNFGDKLKNYRKNNNMKQKDMAELLGMARTAISELENGKRTATLKTIELVAEKTSTKVSDWIDENEDNIEVQPFDGLKTLLRAFIDAGLISEDGKVTDGAKKAIDEMLEKEIELFAENYKKQK